MSRWRERRFIIPMATIVALLLIVLFWRTCHRKSANEETAGDIEVSVRVAKAESGTIANEITTVATLAPRREAAVSPRVSAMIAQMPLLTNRSVRAGDVLAVLESRDLSTQRAEAAAAVTEADATAHTTAHGNVPLTNAQDTRALRDARANVDNARKTYERRQVLHEQGGISKKDLEASQLVLTQAEDDLKMQESSTDLHRGVTNPGDVRVSQAKAQQARSRLANLDAQLGYTVIRAPFSGVVTQQFQYQGELANPGAKLVTIADTSALIAKMQLGEETATRLKVGDTVQIASDDLPGQTFPGTINLVGRAADPQNRSVEVWVAVQNTGGRLRANGVARVIIAAQTVTNAVVIPSSAVTLDATTSSSGTVMVVDDNLIAHEMHVTIGVRSAGRTQITSGLQGSETVVIEGNYGLPDGTKVAIARDDAAAGATPPPGRAPREP